MNRRGLFLGVILTALIAGAGVLYWYFFPSSSDAPIITPTPSPVISIGVLPTTSTVPIAFGGVCPDTWASQQDADRDSLPDAVEAVYRTDANTIDTDGDTYSDGDEVRAGYNPVRPGNERLDTDNDALFDNDECKWGTDPFNPDSDTDGFRDGAEVQNGFDPAKKGDGSGNDRLPVVTPAFTPTPTPTQATNFSPTPTSGPVNSTTPGRLTLVPFSQLKITSATSAADVKAYLSQIDTLRPEEFSDGQVVANAIQAAANGNTAQLTQVRTRIAQFAVSLKGVATPRPAQEYQQLYVSLIEFTAQQLQIIEQNATGANQQKAVQAVLDIQNVLPPYVAQLSQLRAVVEGISNQ
jgi:Bacterial TSP3 repeat